MSTVKIKPCGDQVLVRPMKREQKPGSIVIPGASGTYTDRGEVVAVGPGRMNEAGDILPMRIGEGDYIFYSARSGFGFAFEGEAYLILREGEILGIFRSAVAKQV